MQLQLGLAMDAELKSLIILWKLNRATLSLLDNEKWSKKSLAKGVGPIYTRAEFGLSIAE